jgi:hypothetical protein
MPDRPEHYLASVSTSTAGNTSVHIEDLQGGEFVAAVEVGEYEETMRIGEAPVDVPTGGTAAVTVSIDPSILNVPRTHLFGTIEVPEGLDRRQCRLFLTRLGGGERPFSQPLDEMSFHRGDESHLRWDAGLVRTGDYDAIIRNIEHRLVIHAPGPGETQVAIQIPPLTTVVVEVVDAQNGANLEPAKLQWRGPRLEGRSDFELGPLFRDPRTHRFEFVTTRGEVEIVGRVPGYESIEKKLALDGPEVTCTLALNRVSGLRILFRQDGAAITVDLDAMYRVRVITEAGVLDPHALGESTDSELSVTVRTPGRYRIEFPEFKGFEAIEPKLVDVNLGEVLDVTVDLRPKR